MPRLETICPIGLFNSSRVSDQQYLHAVVADVQPALYNALGDVVTKHPKVLSTVSIVLITVGSIVLFPGVTACAAGTVLAHPAVTVAGGISVVVGKLLRTAVHSATANRGVEADV
jgi:hypothetical protein